MMPSRVPCVPDNLLGLSWHDSNWIPILNPSNVMDYFSERSNPFYDRTCNNEVVKMQRLSLDQLTNMTGLEYQLLHVQEPILYVIRKQHRYSSTSATPLANYYIIAGVVYQAPDLASVINSRILCCVAHLQSGFEEAQGNARYHPSKGYWWSTDTTAQGRGQNTREEPSSLFQRQRVDMLLGEMTKRFPIPPPSATVQPTGPQTTSAVTTSTTATTTTTSATPITANIKKEPVDTVEIKTEPREIKSEKMDSPGMKPPPEKKPRLG